MAIKGANVAKGMKFLLNNDHRWLKKWKKLLLIWIDKKQLASVSEAIICGKVRLHNDLLIKNPGTDAYRSSRGWFKKC